MTRSAVKKSKWVVKIGSGVLLDSDGGVDRHRVQSLVDSVASLRAEGVQITLISSGAVALGRHALGDDGSNQTLPRLQALAATGQSQLMRMYDEAFGSTLVAQILLTREDFNDRRRVANARSTFHELMRESVVPIVNENDTVATEELAFGDNDQLAAMTAYLLKADFLVVLSVAPGVCKIENGVLGDVIGTLACDDPDLGTLVLDEKSVTGRGGMRTKIDAASFAGSCGIPTVIAPGKEDDVLLKIRKGVDIGTYFSESESGVSEPARKAWISLSNQVEGRLVCDEGAKQAILDHGASLLPAGIKSVDGQFSDGALIELCDLAGVVFAKGVAVYDSSAIRKIAGRKSSQIFSLLGYKVLDTIVHRDGLVLESGRKK